MSPAFARFLAVLLIHPCLLICSGGCFTDGQQATQKDQSPMSSPEIPEFTRLRERMVRDQLRARDISDPRVLAAMLKVPRHEFVSADLARSAYDDGALPLDLGQTISQPYIVAFMTQALELRGTERVLEIGTGSGYQAAILAEIVPEVYTIEILPQLRSGQRQSWAGWDTGTSISAWATAIWDGRNTRPLTGLSLRPRRKKFRSRCWTS